MMVEIVLPIAVLAMLLLFVDQVRRLFSHAILNRTIRKAMEIHPQSVALLIAKIESPRRWAGDLAGWILIAAGIAFALAALFDDPAARNATFRAAILCAALGISITAYAWRVQRASQSGEGDGGHMMAAEDGSP